MRSFCQRRKEVQELEAASPDSFAQKFAALDASALVLESAPSKAGPEPEKKKRGVAALIVLIVLALLTVSVVRGGVTAPRRPATTGGRLGGGVRCEKGGHMRSSDKSRPCKVCEKLEAKGK